MIAGRTSAETWKNQSMTNALPTSWLFLPATTGRRRWLLGGVVLGALALVGALDFCTPYGFGFHAFYLLPVLLSAWTLGRRMGLACALLSALIWYGVDLASGHPFSSEFYRGWALLNHLGSYAVIAFVTGNLREHFLLEASLRQEHEAGQTQYQIMLQTAQDGVWLVDDHGRVQEANPAACQMLGHTREELRGMSLVDLEAAESVEAIRAHSAEIRAKGSDLFQSVLRRRDGSTFPVEVSVTYQRDSRQFVVYVHDITLRTQAEQARLRNEKVHALLYRIANATLESASLQDLFREIHVALAQLLPARNFYVAIFDERTRLLTFPYFIDERDPAPAPREVGKALTDLVFVTGKAMLLTEAEIRALTAAGTVDLVGTPPREWLGVPLVLKGTPIGVLTVQEYGQETSYSREDIALLQFIAAEVGAMIRRKQAEEALVNSEERFFKVFNSAPVLAALSNLADGRLIEVNERYCRVLGYTREELLGRTTLELGIVRLEDRERLVGGLGEPRERPSVEFSMYGRNGQPIPCLFSGETLEVGGERLLISMSAEITDLKRAEGERQLLQAEVEHMQKLESLGRLAGGVAHDMNNVLGAILALASTHLVTEAPGSPVHRTFQTISDAATRGGSMVKQLLNFARQSPVERRELDLNGIVRAVAGLLERTTLARINLALDLAPELHPIHGDESALVHAVMNLCVNALDAMEAGGTLTLATRAVGPDQVGLEVRDTGSGMARDVLERALDPFYTTKEVGKGTGLGLSMVFTTVKAHGGQLHIQSEPGQGTTVTLLFPARAADLKTQAAAAIPRPEPASRALAVLLVDDDDLIQKSTRILVEALGHQVSGAASGEEAMAMLEQGLRPDVVILDMNMPGYGGKGTLPRLRALCPDLPVLLATGRADQEALELVAAHPRVTLMAKPYSLQELQGQLRKL